MSDVAARTSIMDRYSIEITAKDCEKLAEAAPLLDPGTHISVTFLPGEEFSRRLAAVEAVLKAGMQPVPHLSARRLTSEAELDTYLGDLASLGGCKYVFIIAGDPDVADGPFSTSLDVINTGLLAKHGVQHVGIGGHPEGHPAVGNDVLMQFMQDKTAALKAQNMGITILTQFGFNTTPVFAWLKTIRAAGIDAPVRLGTPGPASATTLMKFAARCGVAASKSVMKKYGFSLAKLMQPAGPDKYIGDLVAGMDPAIHGDVGLHFYPFGGLIKTAGWIQDFKTKI